MRHHNRIKKFGRRSNQRKALMKSLAYNLVIKGKIKTTQAKAKALKPLAEKLVTLGKKQTMASLRELESRVGKIAAKKIAKTYAPAYKDRQGGYTRITKLVRRPSDGSSVAVIEFVA